MVGDRCRPEYCQDRQLINVHGFTGLAHDAMAFEHSAVVKYEDWFFNGEEFAWTDSFIVMTFWYVFGTDLTFSNFLNFIFTWD